MVDEIEDLEDAVGQSEAELAAVRVCEHSHVQYLLDTLYPTTT